MMSNLPPLNVDTLWAILNDAIDDATVNALIWHCLGYRFDEATEQWDTSLAAPEWQTDQPPDFIASRPASVKLTRSIPPANKQLLKETLGFAGYKINELTPHKTRRATAVNWLLGYINSSDSFWREA